mgnify:CR=1 FL=1
MPKTSLRAHYRRSMQKNGSKNHLIFQKSDDFESWKNGHYAKALCKGYSLCKMVSLGQKIKLPKTSEKRFYKHITDVLCKKRLQKALNMRKMRQFWKLEKWPLRKGLWKMVSLGQKIKLPKTCQKRLYERIRGVLCKKRLQKTLNMREMRQFWKLEKWPQRLQPLQKGHFGSKNKIA